MDTLTGQNNGFELAETEKESGKCSLLEPQDKDFSAYAPQLFSNYIFFYVYDFSDIDECKGNHSCHVNATPLDHMYVNVTLVILEMGKTAQVNLISSLQYSRIVLHDTFDYSAAPSSCVARQLDNLSLRNSVMLSSRVHLLECSSRYLMRI